MCRLDRVLAAGLLVALSCGGNDGMTLDEARDRAVAFVDATVDAAGREYPHQPDPGNGYRDCRGVSGQDDDLAYSYSVEFELPDADAAERLLEETRRHWEAEGLEIVERNLETDTPALHAEDDDRSPMDS